jgi:hypothetical protein
MKNDTISPRYARRNDMRGKIVLNQGTNCDPVISTAGRNHIKFHIPGRRANGTSIKLKIHKSRRQAGRPLII